MFGRKETVKTAAEPYCAGGGENCVTILGARGSIPVSGPEFARYGGATTSILLRLGGEPLLLDAGTGMVRLPPAVLALPRLPLLLTHPHLDHIQGLTLSPYVFSPAHCLEIYAAPRCGLDGEAAVCKLFSPPLWPVGPAELPAQIRFFPLPAAPFSLGRIRVEAMEGVHPGGVSIYRLSGGGVSVVAATDCTLTRELLPALTDFARDCDLLLCDGQYSPEEWSDRSGFGHSTWLDAAALGEACGARMTRILHHDPCHTDDILDAAEAEVRRRWPRCAFAREGEELTL